MIFENLFHSECPVDCITVTEKGPDTLLAFSRIAAGTRLQFLLVIDVERRDRLLRVGLIRVSAL